MIIFFNIDIVQFLKYFDTPIRRYIDTDTTILIFIFKCTGLGPSIFVTCNKKNLIFVRQHYNIYLNMYHGLVMAFEHIISSQFFLKKQLTVLAGTYIQIEILITVNVNWKYKY